MKAMSIWTSPDSIARTRPPWERMIARFFNRPVEIASPIFPRTPDDWIPVIVPSSMYGTIGSCAFPKELAQIVISLIPILWTSSMTIFTT